MKSVPPKPRRRKAAKPEPPSRVSKKPAATAAEAGLPASMWFPTPPGVLDAPAEYRKWVDRVRQWYRGVLAEAGVRTADHREVGGPKQSLPAAPTLNAFDTVDLFRIGRRVAIGHGGKCVAVTLCVGHDGTVGVDVIVTGTGQRTTVERYRDRKAVRP